MKKYFGKANIALIIAMMFILAFFGGEAMKTHTIDGSASNLYVGSALDKVEDDYTVAEPEKAPNQELDISIEQSLNLTLGEWYSSDGKYANPTIPVYTIQKTRSDTENMVILICGEGYTKNQQQKFVNDVKKVPRSRTRSKLSVPEQSIAPIKMTAAGQSGGGISVISQIYRSLDTGRRGPVRRRALQHRQCSAGYDPAESPCRCL